MRAEGLSEAAISAFIHSYTELTSGNTGMIEETSISSVDSLPSLDSDIKGVITPNVTLLQVLMVTI